MANKFLRYNGTNWTLDQGIVGPPGPPGSTGPAGSQGLSGEAVLIYRPGASTIGNVYGDWSDALTNRQAIDGPMTIIIDDSLTSPAAITAGGDLGGNTKLVGWRNPNSSSAPQMVINDGIVLFNPSDFINLHIIGQSSAIVFTPDFGFTTINVSCYDTTIENNGASPVFDMSAGGIVNLYGNSHISNPGSLQPVFFADGTSFNTINFNMYDLSIVDSNVITSSSVSCTVGINFGGTSATFSETQGAFSGNLFFAGGPIFTNWNAASPGDLLSKVDQAGAQWIPPNFNMFGDVTGTTENNTVTKLQNRTMLSTAPNNKDYLAWNSTDVAWEPTVPPEEPLQVPMKSRVIGTLPFSYPTNLHFGNSGSGPFITRYGNTQGEILLFNQTDPTRSTIYKLPPVAELSLFKGQGNTLLIDNTNTYMWSAWKIGVNGGDVFRTNVATGHTDRVNISVGFFQVTCMAFAPNNKVAVTFGNDNRLFLIDQTTLAVDQSHSYGSNGLFGVYYDGNLNQIAISSSDPAVYVIDPNTYALNHTIPIAGQAAFPVSPVQNTAAFNAMWVVSHGGSLGTTPQTLSKISTSSWTVTNTASIPNDCNCQYGMSIAFEQTNFQLFLFGTPSLAGLNGQVYRIGNLGGAPTVTAASLSSFVGNNILLSAAGALVPGTSPAPGGVFTVATAASPFTPTLNLFVQFNLDGTIRQIDEIAGTTAWIEPPNVMNGPWIVTTSPYNAFNNDGFIMVNTTSSAITVNLPTSPGFLETHILKDYGVTFATHNLTISGSGHNIEQDGGTFASTYTASTNNKIVRLIYDGTQWRQF